MDTRKVQFPHITRLFPAFSWSLAGAWIERFILWTILIAFLIMNIITLKAGRSKLSQLFFPLLINPFSVTQHISAAKLLWDSGYQKTATRELVIAQDLVEGGGSVLGATSDPTALLNKWEQEPSKLKALYDYWKSVTQKRPDYRDGFLTAGAYAYQTGNSAEAKQLFEKAYDLDPNFAPTVRMLKKIEQ